MIKNDYYVIGVMSGTSLDGIDLAYIHFSFDTDWSFEFIHVETIGYSKTWLDILKNLVQNSKAELKPIDLEYTHYLAEVINSFIGRHTINQIDAVCSHGHTALHRPDEGLTYQIGNQEHLANLLNEVVVCDFRVQDVALGGQGAPLVPIGDTLLFSEYDFCLNLGGFANISTAVAGKRIAYDICPVNIVLNYYVAKLDLAYDNKGIIAATGRVQNELLEHLNALDFYQKSYPKSLGLEWVTKEVLPIIDTYTLEVKDILRTFVEHIAVQISRELNKNNNSSVLITGGGVYNSFLIDRLSALAQNRIIIPSKVIIEFKEALIFGFLGVLKLRGEVNCLSAVTGAKHNHSSGKIYLPEK